MTSTNMEVPGEEPKPSASPTVGESGLLPLSRLTSDERLARIRPDSLAKTEFFYHSVFIREFLRSDFNFSASKMTVARGGKLLAIEAEFRVAESWFKKALTWANALPGRPTMTYPESVTLEIKHPMSGRLIRLITLYDQLFLKTREALVARAVSSEVRQNTLAAAQARIEQIPFLCEPDNEHFAPEGVLLPDPDDIH